VTHFQWRRLLWHAWVADLPVSVEASEFNEVASSRCAVGDPDWIARIWSVSIA